MGAPGQAFVCERGHLFKQQAAKSLLDGCPCGEKTVFVIMHYGNLNDCYFSKHEIERGLGFMEVASHVIGKEILTVYNIREVISQNPDILKCRVTPPVNQPTHK